MNCMKMNMEQDTFNSKLLGEAISVAEAEENM